MKRLVQNMRILNFDNIDSSIKMMTFISTLILAAIIFKFFSYVELIINNKDITLKMYIFIYYIILVFLVYRYWKIKKERKKGSEENGKNDF